MMETKNNSQPKVGVYICYCGGNISDHVDVEKVRERVEKLEEVAVARTNMFMCSDPGQDMIIEDLKAGRINRVVVASCAPSLHETTFKGAIMRAGANPYIYEHANIREQVSWVHHGKEATDKATKLVYAAVKKAALLKPLEPIRVNTKKHVTVIGGGFAGLKSARDLANIGFKVTLIEKSPYLGGHVAHLDKLYPTNIDAKTALVSLIKEVLFNKNIDVYTCGNLKDFSGYIGNFNLKVEIKRPDYMEQIVLRDRILDNAYYVDMKGVFLDNIKNSEINLETGAIVIATGFKTYEPKVGEYGYKNFKEVITLPQLIHLLSNEGVSSDGYLKFRGRRIRSMAFIHCVGSRQIPGIDEEREDGTLNEYCSRVCCSTILSYANKIRAEFPNTQVYDLYRDIRTYGRYQEELYTRASENRVKFIRFEPAEKPEIQKGILDYPLLIKVKDTLTFNEEIGVPVDLVVLGVGMEPNPINNLVSLMKIPVGNDGFLQEVHPKLRPVETSVDGVVLAGTAQAPMDTSEVSNSASCASVKISSLLGKGYVEVDPFIAEVDKDKCKGHGKCIEACLRDGALIMKDGKAEVVPALCAGCGACVPVCPEGAIQIAGSTLKQYEAMVDAIVNDEIIQD
ncbi:CoB--CoM heterodisulfide reductase iron-sulfur subunit A family protein [Desulfothermus sp.]